MQKSLFSKLSKKTIVQKSIKSFQKLYLGKNSIIFICWISFTAFCLKREVCIGNNTKFDLSCQWHFLHLTINSYSVPYHKFWENDSKVSIQITNLKGSFIFLYAFGFEWSFKSNDVYCRLGVKFASKYKLSQ